MIVLGLNAFGHDAAVVLLRDGEVVFASSEERFDRVRHSPAFPQRALAAALDRAGIDAASIDHVAFPWTRDMGRRQKLWHVLRHLPRSLAFLREPPDELLPDRRGYLQAMRSLERTVLEAGIRAPVRRIPHHRAHAASARLALPGGDGLILTADGMGEWTTAGVWHAEGGQLRALARASYPHSPGKAYAAVTQWLGWRPESQEGKTMGLAAYGDASHETAAFTRSLLTADPTHVLRVRTEAFGFPWGHARLYGDAFLAALGPARERDEDLRANDAHVARGIQDAVEAMAESVARAGLAETGATALGLAGGLFLNCAMNGELQRRLDVPVHPFPVAGDAGAAWGAAAEVHHQETGALAAPLGTLRLGHEITDAEVAGVVTDRPHERPTDLASLVDAVAARIARGEILAIARGRAEFGPRALGSRSVFASPTTRASRDLVNERKGRETWRPVAPIVREDDDAWFEDMVPSRHMILTFPATPRAQAEIPGVLHEDDTARVQTIAADGDPFVRGVLDALARRGQPGVVINTSLNRPGEPIVNTAAEAWTAADAMGVDAVVLGDVIVPLAGT